MADGYRAITRLGLLFDALGKRTLTALAKPSGDVVSDRLNQLSHFFHTFYCIFENTAVYAGHGALPSSLGRLGGCAVTCWFYVLTISIINILYKLLKKGNLTKEEKNKELVTLLKLSLFWVFSQTCLPKGGPALLEDVSGPLAPLHHIIRAIAPKHLELNDSIRGSLGFVASMCDFY
ncbi:Gim5A protein [Angomonas deanei]|nr:Gim5A protein [Angomonas deanei]|eukprot:EPY30377.1 Gim5A protein [Angomonas deanei]